MLAAGQHGLLACTTRHMLTLQGGGHKVDKDTAVTILVTSYCTKERECLNPLESTEALQNKMQPKARRVATTSNFNTQ